MNKKEKTTDAVAILRRRFVGEDPARLAALEHERLHAKVARQIFDLRTQAGLTQRELAKQIGTTQSVISRLEDADYEGHSLSMLRRIAEALGATVDVELGAADRAVKTFVFRTVMHLLRRSKGLTLDELASKSQILREELAAIEQHEGYRPSPRTVHQLGRFYGLAPGKLAALAGAVEPADDEIRDPAFRFAALSENFSELPREERRALREFVAALREEHPK
jgi:transcriptional regulator with XRE-family HTH domain